jgi:hypothetical protein
MGTAMDDALIFAAVRKIVRRHSKNPLEGLAQLDVDELNEALKITIRQQVRRQRRRAFRALWRILAARRGKTRPSPIPPSSST